MGDFKRQPGALKHNETIKKVITQQMGDEKVAHISIITFIHSCSYILHLSWGFKLVNIEIYSHIFMGAFASSPLFHINPVLFQASISMIVIIVKPFLGFFDKLYFLVISIYLMLFYFELEVLTIRTKVYIFVMNAFCAKAKIANRHKLHR